MVLFVLFGMGGSFFILNWFFLKADDMKMVVNVVVEKLEGKMTSEGRNWNQIFEQVTNQCGHVNSFWRLPLSIQALYILEKAPTESFSSRYRYNVARYNHNYYFQSNVQVSSQ